MTPRPIDLSRVGWVADLLEAFLAAHDAAASQRSAVAVRCAHPDADRVTLAERLADARLGGLRASAPPLPDALRARLAEGSTAFDHARAGVLVAAWDVLMAVAALHENRSGPEERTLELLTVMALGFEDVKLARRLHDAHLARRDRPAGAAGRASIEAYAAAIERRVEARDAQRERLLGHPIGVVLVHVEVRALAGIGALYFERSAIEEEGVERLHELSRAQKVTLITVLTALAWADGKLVDDERRLIEQYVALSGLPPRMGKRLLAALAKAPNPFALELEPLAPAARRFVLEQAILLSLVDDDLDPSELALLESVAAKLGATPTELEQVMVEVTAFYEDNRDTIHDFGPVSGAFGRLRALVVDRAHEAVKKNTRRLVQEVKETGELAKLLGAASVRPLTREEAAKVKAQLLDICKTIPALAIFALPGGALLLPVLLKVLPFNLLPTAFSEDPAGSE